MQKGGDFQRRKGLGQKASQSTIGAWETCGRQKTVATIKKGGEKAKDLTVKKSEDRSVTAQNKALYGRKGVQWGRREGKVYRTALRLPCRALGQKTKEPGGLRF